MSPAACSPWIYAIRRLHHLIVFFHPLDRQRGLKPFSAEIAIVVHWSGGVQIRLTRRRRGQRNSTPADVIAAVRELALIASDDLIAGLLNRNGLKTGHGNRWTRERVTSLRSHHRIPVFKTADVEVEPWLNPLIEREAATPGEKRRSGASATSKYKSRDTMPPMSTSSGRRTAASQSRQFSRLRRRAISLAR